jgi:hypothetical protein
VRIIENIETGNYVYLREKPQNVFGGTSFRVTDLGVKNANSAV